LHKRFISRCPHANHTVSHTHYIETLGWFSAAVSKLSLLTLQSTGSLAGCKYTLCFFFFLFFFLLPVLELHEVLGFRV
jgi:hypothetical protein